MNTKLSSRRSFLLSIALFSLFGKKAFANNETDWNAFKNRMLVLANTSNKLSSTEVSTRGLQYLNRLNIDSKEFKQAENASYESGNRYWLWQRLIKSQNLNGGILNVENDQAVQLHDHPNAIGLLRIISGITEVWQFDDITESDNNSDIVKLTRVSRKTLYPGDTAILTPTKGNIHALRATSKQCRMLDFFIPPYKRSKRNWYEPLDANWQNNETILCKKIPQHTYSKA